MEQLVCINFWGQVTEWYRDRQEQSGSGWNLFHEWLLWFNFRASSNNKYSSNHWKPFTNCKILYFNLVFWNIDLFRSLIVILRSLTFACGNKLQKQIRLIGILEMAPRLTEAPVPLKTTVLLGGKDNIFSSTQSGLKKHSLLYLKAQCYQSMRQEVAWDFGTPCMD